jgi:hypothetical protein
VELTQLFSKRYIVPAYDRFVNVYKFEKLDIIYSEETPLDIIKDEKFYIIKVITLSIVFILMHTFSSIFDITASAEISWKFVFLIFVCLIGSAMILIAIGFWEEGIHLEK